MLSGKRSWIINPFSGNFLDYLEARAAGLERDFVVRCLFGCDFGLTQVGKFLSLRLLRSSICRIKT